MRVRRWWRYTVLRRPRPKPITLSMIDTVLRDEYMTQLNLQLEGASPLFRPAYGPFFRDLLDKESGLPDWYAGTSCLVDAHATCGGDDW